MKVIGSGVHAEVVTVFRFNAPLIEQLRGILSDIAKETGGRKDVRVLEGDIDSPLKIWRSGQVDLTRLSDEEL